MTDLISRAETVRLVAEAFLSLAERLEGHGMKDEANSARRDCDLAIKLIDMTPSAKLQVAEAAQ